MKQNLVRYVMALVVALGLMVAFGVAPASADTKTHEGAGVQLDVPEGWATESDGDVLVLSTPDEAVSIMLAVLDAGDLQAAVEAMDAELAKFVTDVELGEPAEQALNGMKALTVDGRGKAEGEAVELGVAIVAAPTGKVILLLGVAKAGAMETHGEQIAATFQSLQPAK